MLLGLRPSHQFDVYNALPAVTAKLKRELHRSTVMQCHATQQLFCLTCLTMATDIVRKGRMNYGNGEPCYFLTSEQYCMFLSLRRR